MFNDSTLQSLVWLDYRLAVVFTVILPLILIIWAFVQKFEAVQRLLTIYWRVASLLAITVYLAIASLPISFLTGGLARILIPIALWFWADLNDEIDDAPRKPLKWVLTSWRWAVTVYCLIGVLFQLPAFSCATLSREEVLSTMSCRVWLEAPWGYQAMFHANASPDILGFLGIVGLVAYVLCLLYFAFVRLAKQGRSAMG